MKKYMLAAGAVALAACATPAMAQQAAAAADNGVFYGGTLGLGFGDVDYVEIAPLIGKRINPKVAIGGSLIYRHRSDNRYQKDLNTDDYGASVFGRYNLTPRLFAQAEYEYLKYEYYRANLTKDTDTANSLFLGGGVTAPLGGRTSMYFTALYNVNYDDDAFVSPYSSPWVLRLGVGVGF